jgi:hypothetical protein
LLSQGLAGLLRLVLFVSVMPCLQPLVWSTVPRIECLFHSLLPTAF